MLLVIRFLFLGWLVGTVLVVLSGSRRNSGSFLGWFERLKGFTLHGFMKGLQEQFVMRLCFLRWFKGL